MNNYNNNNYTSVAGTDSPMRFKKRQRYAANSNGANNSPRYNKYQNQTGYKYSPNRSCALDNFQHKQYDTNSNICFYNNSPNRTNYSQQQSNQQSPSYSQKSIPSSPSTLSTKTQNINLSPQTDRSTAKPASATVTAQNIQNQQPFTSNVENSSYYMFPFNYFPSTYNADLIPTASNLAFGGVDGMSSYMWQTITSTPPPKLPHQKPPLPLQHPPALPPLPSPEMPHLPPPPPIPTSIIDSTFTPATTEHLDQNSISNNQDSGPNTIIKMKTKRKAMSARYKLSKRWSEEDAILALKAEEANALKLKRDSILIIRFPDPEISREIIKNYSPDIESVHFQLNFAPRYCLIHLKPGTDIDKTIDHLSKIQFGTGHLSVEIKQVSHKAHTTKLNEIDPFTLYVGNLPTTIACRTLKEHFPGAIRIDIGFPQRLKYTRYAFIRYSNVHLAIEAYERMLNAEIGGRTLTVRFRRLISASEGNKDADAENNDGLHDELIGQPNADGTRERQNDVEDVETIANSENKNKGNGDLEKSSNDNGTTQISDEPPQQENISMSANLTETNESAASPLSTHMGDESTSQANTSNTSLFNVKPEPDVDPRDIVVRNNTIGNRCENTDSFIKQEQENLALYEEFFDRPQNQNDIAANSNRNNRNSLTSNTEDNDPISQLSSNSLGEFLRSCQSSQKQTANSSIRDAEPPMKRNKLPMKRELLEVDSTATERTTVSSSKETTNTGVGCVKQEAEERIANLNTSAERISSIESNTVSSSRNKTSNTNSFEGSHNITANNDDIPSTALFFTSDYRNKWSNCRNNCDKEDFYDEFYGVRVSSQTSSSQSRFKSEPLDNSIRKNTNERNNKTRQLIQQNQNVSVGNQNICKEKSNRYVATTSNALLDDDLVPAENILGSYRPHKEVVKLETEYDNLYSAPFAKSRQINTDLDEDSLTNSTSSITECTKIIEVSEPDLTESNDEDVIVVSANIPPAPKQKNFNNSVYNNLVIPRLTDLVSFNYKPLPSANHNRAASTHLIRDHLDELYDQLDADSDSEL